VRSLPVIACALLVWTACSTTDPPPDPRPALLRGVVDEVILPGHRALAVEAAKLAQAAETFCAGPGDVEPVRAAWQGARSAWKQVELFAFGPQVAYPARLGAAIDFWPVRPDTIEALLASSEPLDALAGRGAAERGLPVIEYLLYGPQADFAQPRRCTYLLAATEDLAQSTAALRDAWEPEAGGFAHALTDPGEVFAGPQEALSEVVNRLWFALEDIRKDKLGAPLGPATGSPQPDKAESQFAGRSLADIRDVLASIERVVFGPAGDGGLSVHPALTPARDQALRGALDHAFTALAAVPEPLTQAIFDNPVAVVAASDALKDLQRVIQVDVIGAMGLNVAFNDNDGD